MSILTPLAFGVLIFLVVWLFLKTLGALARIGSAILCDAYRQEVRGEGEPR